MTNPGTNANQARANGTVEYNTVPGIYADTRPPEVRARLVGTGIEVWEIVRNYLEAGRDWQRFRDGLHWLTDEQLQAALEFGRLHAAIINEHIQENYAGYPEDLQPDPSLRWP